MNETVDTLFATEEGISEDFLSGFLLTYFGVWTTDAPGQSTSFVIHYHPNHDGGMTKDHKL